MGSGAPVKRKTSLEIDNEDQSGGDENQMENFVSALWPLLENS